MADDDGRILILRRSAGIGEWCVYRGAKQCHIGGMTIVDDAAAAKWVCDELDVLLPAAGEAERLRHAKERLDTQMGTIRSQRDDIGALSATITRKEQAAEKRERDYGALSREGAETASRLRDHIAASLQERVAKDATIKSLRGQVAEAQSQGEDGVHALQLAYDDVAAGNAKIKGLREQITEGNALVTSLREQITDRDAMVSRLSAANGRLKRANEGLSEQVIYRDAMVTSLHAESDKSYRDMRAAERRETAAVSKAASLEVVEALAFRGMSITTEQYWHDCADWCDANGKRGYAEAIRKMVHALAAYQAGKPAEQVAEEPAAAPVCASCAATGSVHVGCGECSDGCRGRLCGGCCDDRVEARRRLLELDNAIGEARQ